MSASNKPTFPPRRCSASARFTAVVDLPTPPLPEATTTMWLTWRRLGVMLGWTRVALMTFILLMKRLRRSKQLHSDCARRFQVALYLIHEKGALSPLFTTYLPGGH